jgi:hypothetical protein
VKSLHELETEDAEFRNAKANATAEVERLRDRRKRLLVGGDIDEILALDDEIRRQEISGEVADARARELLGPIYFSREELKRWAGVNMPTDDELDQLLAIVIAAHPEEFRNAPKEFKRAFYAVGRLGRLNEPSTDRYFVSSIDDANEILREHRLQGIEGDMLLAAVIAWGDISWRAPDKNMGAQLEISLAKRFSGSPAKPKWRDLLTGKASLVAPLPPRAARASSSTYPEPRVRIRYPDGREVDPAAPLGVR